MSGVIVPTPVVTPATCNGAEEALGYYRAISAVTDAPVLGYAVIQTDTTGEDAVALCGFGVRGEYVFGPAEFAAAVEHREAMAAIEDHYTNAGQPVRYVFRVVTVHDGPGGPQYVL